MKRLFLMLPALLAAMVMSAHAQTDKLADPADPAQPGRPAHYHSTFDGYLPHQNPSTPSLDNWRAANDLVGALAGHGGHLDAPNSATHHHGDHPLLEQDASPATAPIPTPGQKEHHHAY